MGMIWILVLYHSISIDNIAYDLLAFHIETSSYYIQLPSYMEVLVNKKLSYPEGLREALCQLILSTVLHS